MEYASGHNSFNILFVVTFFATLAIVMISREGGAKQTAIHHGAMLRLQFR